MCKKQTKRLLLTALFAATGTALALAQNEQVDSGKYDSNWESLAQWECPEWFKDAKFGIWAHWGPQCAAESGDWYGRGMYEKGGWQYNYHVKTFGDPKDFGLKDLCNAWKAENWNPDELVKLYKEVGARYFFTLGQHHDNFDLWENPYQEWNSVNVGPKKDIVKGWAEACKKYDLPLGISMHGSHAWTWLEGSQDFDGNLTKADGAGLWWDGLDPQELYAQRHKRCTSGGTHWEWQDIGEAPSEAYKQKFQNRVIDAINRFEPAMLYFDDTVLPFYYLDNQVGLDILKHYYNHMDGNCVVMGKILEPNQKAAMLWDVERGVPADIQPEYWQTCTCIGSWHYDRGIYERGHYKSAQQVIDMLVDVVSKNGNLLLSIPIRSDGTIDEKEREVLSGIKAWMDQNGESIYGTRPWRVCGEGPQVDNPKKLNAQGFNEKNDYSAQDVRYVQKTSKGAKMVQSFKNKLTKSDAEAPAKTIYATIMRWPDGRTFTFDRLAAGPKNGFIDVKRVRLLGHGKVKFEQTIYGLTVTLPETPCNAIAPVFEITLR